MKTVGRKERGTTERRRKSEEEEKRKGVRKGEGRKEVLSAPLTESLKLGNETLPPL